MKKKEEKQEQIKLRPTIKDCNHQIELLSSNTSWLFTKVNELQRRIEELEKTEAEYKFTYKPAKKAWLRFW